MHWIRGCFALIFIAKSLEDEMVLCAFSLFVKFKHGKGSHIKCHSFGAASYQSVRLWGTGCAALAPWLQTCWFHWRIRFCLVICGVQFCVGVTKLGGDFNWLRMDFVNGWGADKLILFDKCGIQLTQLARARV